MKYSANRCDLPMGDDMENKTFARKADAIKWAKKCHFGKVRKLVNGHPVIHNHSNFTIPSF